MKYTHWQNGAILVASTLFSLPALAGDATLGDMAQNLMGPAGIITKVMMMACYLIGTVLIFVAMAQYKQHRQSPKLVPLATPIVMLILGVVALLIPYTTKQFETGSAEQHEAQAPEKSSLPMPNVSGGHGPTLPLPGGAQAPAPAPTENQPPPAPSTAPSGDAAPTPQPAPDQSAPAPADQGGSGHWTDQYK